MLITRHARQIGPTWSFATSLALAATALTLGLVPTGAAAEGDGCDDSTTTTTTTTTTTSPAVVIPEPTAPTVPSTVADLTIIGPAVVVTNPPVVVTSAPVASVEPAVLDARAVAGPVQLPSTGTDAGATAAVAATLVAAGAALVALRRRPA